MRPNRSRYQRAWRNRRRARFAGALASLDVARTGRRTANIGFLHIAKNPIVLAGKVIRAITSRYPIIDVATRSLALFATQGTRN